jgi:hypothetical protein
MPARRQHGLTIALLILVGSGIAAADEGYRYVAVLHGACERLVVADRELTAGCARKLVNIDFGDGRVTFIFATGRDGRRVVAFSGGRSEQADRRSYRLYVDQVSVTASTRSGGVGRTVAQAADGVCTMTGDPMREPSIFRCRAESGTALTAAVFRSDGRPTLYPGARDGG